MLKSTKLRRGRNCVFALHVHLVFVTKYRRAVFTRKILADLREIFQNVCRDFEASLVEFEGERDHVHLLVSLLCENGNFKASEFTEGCIFKNDSTKGLSYNQKCSLG